MPRSRGSSHVMRGRMDLARVVLIGHSLVFFQYWAVAASAQSSSTAPDSKSDAVRGDLSEVVVTAQRREENLQNVPISISVLSGAALENPTILSARDALTTIPGIAVNTQYTGKGTQITVRGVAAGQALFSGSAPVAYYLDSMPFGLVKSSIAPDQNAYDLQRIEALRGPQGTLYGASALNGVVRVLTNDADFDDFEVKGRVSGSSTNEGGGNYRADLAANAPIIDGKLAIRGIVGYENDSGWIETPDKRNSNDVRAKNYRLKIGAQPTDDLSVRAGYWGSRSNFGGPDTGGDNAFTPSMFSQETDTGFDAYDVKVAYQFGGYSLSSTTSYLDFDYDAHIDFTSLVGFPLPIGTHVTSNIFVQEVLLNSPVEKQWRWSLGGIFRRGTEGRFQTLMVSGDTLSSVDNTSKSWAAFGEATRVLIDGKLEATVGLRHFEDHVEQVGLALGGSLLSNDGDFKSTTPRAVLTWYVNDRMTVYGSFAQGFRSGFPAEITAPPGTPGADADTLTNYEIGAKGALWDGRLGFDTAVYYMKWRDVQTTIGVPVIFNGQPAFTNATINGESASGPGVDLSLSTEPLSGLTLGLTASWNGLEMDGVVISDGVALWNKGDRLNTSPETTLGALADYAFSIGGGLRGKFSALVSHASTQSFRSTPGEPRVVLGFGDPITIGRVALSIESDRKWTATLFVNNVNNEQGAPIRPFLDPALTSRIRPRTTGLQVEYRFQ